MSYEYISKEDNNNTQKKDMSEILNKTLEIEALYNNIPDADKRKYLNRLTEWLMREKDRLNRI